MKNIIKYDYFKCLVGDGKYYYVYLCYFFEPETQSWAWDKNHKTWDAVLEIYPEDQYDLIPLEEGKK